MAKIELSDIQSIIKSYGIEGETLSMSAFIEYYGLEEEYHEMKLVSLVEMSNGKKLIFKASKSKRTNGEEE